MVKAAHEKFLTSVNQHLGDSGMHTATEDDDIHELDVKDDLWLLDVNYRCATGVWVHASSLRRRKIELRDNDNNNRNCFTPVSLTPRRPARCVR